MSFVFSLNLNLLIYVGERWKSTKSHCKKWEKSLFEIWKITFYPCVSKRETFLGGAPPISAQCIHSAHHIISDSVKMRKKYEGCTFY